jgi:hypothetical protein
VLWAAVAAQISALSIRVPLHRCNFRKSVFCRHQPTGCCPNRSDPNGQIYQSKEGKRQRQAKQDSGCFEVDGPRQWLHPPAGIANAPRATARAARGGFWGSPAAQNAAASLPSSTLGSLALTRVDKRSRKQLGRSCDLRHQSRKAAKEGGKIVKTRMIDRDSKF